MSQQPAQPSGNLPRPGEGAGPDGSEGRPAPALPDEQSPRQGSEGPGSTTASEVEQRATPAASTSAAASTAPTGAGSVAAARVLNERPQERIRGNAGDRLDQAADAVRRMGHRVRDHGGMAARAEPLAYRVGDSFQSAAEYVRSRDVHGMREDVEIGVRSAPIKSLAVAAAFGFLLGRTLR